VFVATTSCQPTGDSLQRDCVRVGEVNPASSPTSTQTQDFLLAANGLDRFFGGVGMSYNGTLHVTFSESSPSQFISSRAVYQVPGDGANHVSPVETLANGNAMYAGERWGDYLGVAADPQAPGAVWSTTNYSVGDWATSIRRLDTDAGSTYTAISPTRVLDTRSGGAANRLTSSVARTFQVTGGPIPNNAVAVTGNVTVTQQTAAGFVSVMPRPTNSPSTSTLNFPLGDTRANNITLPLGPGGKLSAVYKSGTGQRTHLVVDITGYFTAGIAAAQYATVTPARILDTRIGVGLGGKFHNAVPRAFQVLGAGGVPNDLSVVAITANITVTQQSSGGFVSLTPTSVVTPTTSNINFPIGDNRANGATIPLDAGEAGMVWAVFRGTSTATTHLIVDVTGYYRTGVAGLKFFPLNPGRIMDTRGAPLSGLNGAFTGTTTCPSGVRTLDTAGHQGIPLETAGAAAITGNLTVTRATKAGFVSIRKNLADCPETSTINFPAGDTRANGTTVPMSDAGDLRFRYNSAAGTAHLILDISGYFAP
jgi:hypothetical protein